MLNNLDIKNRDLLCSCVGITITVITSKYSLYNLSNRDYQIFLRIVKQKIKTGERKDTILNRIHNYYTELLLPLHNIVNEVDSLDL